MGLVTIHGYRTLPGKLVEHAALMEEAKQKLQERGLQAALLQPIAGGEVGGIALAVLYADNRAHARALRQFQDDQEWQAWYAGAASSGTAEATEVSIFVDVDPTHVVTDEPAEIMQTTEWRANPGDGMRFMESVSQAKGHIERLGGRVRVMQCMTGLLPMTVSVSVLFEDVEHYGEYSDKLGVDEQFQAYWADAMSRPSATLVRSGLYAIRV